MCCLLGESLSPSLHGSPALPTRDRARSAIASPSEVRHVPAKNTLRSQQYIPQHSRRRSKTVQSEGR